MNIVEQLRQLLSQVFQWWITVTPWQQVVRVRCGKYTKLLSAGLHWKFPIIDTVYMQPVRLRAQYIEPQTVTTLDGKAISLTIAVHYQISNLLDLYNNIHNQSDTISQSVQGELADYVAKRSFDNLSVEQLEQHLAKKLVALYASCGLHFHKTQITNFVVVKTYRLISGSMGPLQSFHDKMVREEK